MPDEQPQNEKAAETSVTDTPDQAPESDASGSTAMTQLRSDAEWLIQGPYSEVPLPAIGLEIDPETAIDWNAIHADPALPYPVVAIGASAGGLQAFQELLEHLPEITGMTFVILSHLAADKHSYLADILARHTRMPVNIMDEGVRPEPNQLYVLPPARGAELVKGVFRLSLRDVGDRVRFPIDTFFRSISADQKNYSIGVVLSGADSDGTLGLQAIKGEGGLALVQSPDTAGQTSMPLSSIHLDHVDYVGSPAQIGAQLVKLAEVLRLPQIRNLEQGLAIPTHEYNLQQILQMLRNVTGLPLRQYKQETVRRRIGRRMVVRRIDSLADYAQFLQVRPDELRILHEDVLINVTHFFRDPDFWHSISTHVLPAIFQDRPSNSTLRIWCAGCATGEEAYSFAITILEYLTANSLDATVQIFGTDASEHAIEMARTAIFPESLVGEITQDRLRRFFTKVDRGYQVSKRVRDCCIFARQNLASDPPFSHIDLLSCRNVLIYFNQALQKRMISTFHYSLKPSGFLMLGMSESLRDYNDFFQASDRKNKIYSKVDGVSTSALRLANPLTINFLPAKLRSGEYMGLQSDGWTDLELQRAADRIVLARCAPPGLIVDDRLNVLQARGQTAPYVELTPGAVSWNLSRVLRQEIASEVRAAAERALRENIPISIVTATSTDGAAPEPLRVEVLPITSAAAHSRSFLVLFTALQGAQKERAVDQIVLSELDEETEGAQIRQLRQDLSSTRFHLQSLIEERDARNQEMVSANEEIQSANEELQSTNEELETTKEELQSANEELQTVNEELQQRNAALSQTGNDLTNLLNSVNIPLLMLTEELKIRQFTPPMERLLNIRSADIGRAISEIRLQLSVEDIELLLIEVLDTLGTRELEVQDREGRWNLLRIRPYRTAENRIEGLVVLLVDIDQLRNSQEELRNARDFASAVVQSVPYPVIVLKKDCTILRVNKAFHDLSQVKEHQLAGRSLPDLLSHLWGVVGLADQLDELIQSGPGKLLEFEHYSTTADKKTLLIKSQALLNDGERVLLLTIEDITLQRESELIAAQRQEALQREVELKGRTLTRAQEELRELAAHLFTVQEEERQRVARELHDDISQRLSLLEIVCSQAGDQSDTHLTSIRKEVHELNSDVRKISHRLHPAILYDLGLPAALKALVEDFGQREQMPATYSGVDVPKNLPEPSLTAFYRIAQEALRNVSKHAGVTHVKVSLETMEDRVRLQVRDFGNGFDQDGEYPMRGLGLISMEERARIAGGTFAVTSSLGNGTHIVVDIPWKDTSEVEES